MFDTVLVPCPKCGAKAEFQSKSGDCVLATYELNEAPEDVLWNVNRHSPYTCHKCRTLFFVDESEKISVYVERERPVIMIKVLQVLSARYCDCCRQSVEYKVVDKETNEAILLCRHHYKRVEKLVEQVVSGEKAFSELRDVVEEMY